MNPKICSSFVTVDLKINGEERRCYCYVAFLLITAFTSTDEAALVMDDGQQSLDLAFLLITAFTSTEAATQRQLSLNPEKTAEKGNGKLRIRRWGYCRRRPDACRPAFLLITAFTSTDEAALVMDDGQQSLDLDETAEKGNGKLIRTRRDCRRRPGGCKGPPRFL
ncbi:hypothetical protein PFLUV_G00134230 [Scomber scombrus]|uniref:Uncharacterized protein n=1 Tax=Scomber scombrus TaxID=13677 RepID=A0AAV1NDW6_SCOSC